jgi:hypothetical protein
LSCQAGQKQADERPESVAKAERPGETIAEKVAFATPRDATASR